MTANFLYLQNISLLLKEGLTVNKQTTLGVPGAQETCEMYVRGGAANKTC